MPSKKPCRVPVRQDLPVPRQQPAFSAQRRTCGTWVLYAFASVCTSSRTHVHIHVCMYLMCIVQGRKI